MENRELVPFIGKSVFGSYNIHNISSNCHLKFYHRKHFFLSNQRYINLKVSVMDLKHALESKLELTVANCGRVNSPQRLFSAIKVKITSKNTDLLFEYLSFKVKIILDQACLQTNDWTI